MFTHVKFAELPVQDQSRAVAFYTQKLGLHVARDAPYGEGWRWIELAIPGASTLILLTRKSETDERNTPRLVLITDDMAATYQRLTAAQVEFTQPPTQAPWNPGETYALFRDSEGNLIMIGSG